jgi:hypothetical protein
MRPEGLGQFKKSTSRNVIHRPIRFRWVGQKENIIVKPKRRWAYNITVDFREIGWGGVDCVCLGSRQGPVEGSCEHSNELSVP